MKGQFVEERKMRVGDKVRHKITGKIYQVREIKKTVLVVQRGSTAIQVKPEKLEPA